MLALMLALTLGMRVKAAANGCCYVIWHRDRGWDLTDGLLCLGRL